MAAGSAAGAGGAGVGSGGAGVGRAAQVPLRDMVDTVPFTELGGGTLTAEGILKVVLGAVNRRLDRRGGAELYC